MKKKWIYGIVVLALVIGLVYVIVDKDEDKDKTAGKDKEEGVVQLEIDEEEKAEMEKEAQEMEEEAAKENPQEEVKDPTQFPDIIVGEKLPDFTLESLDGESINLRELEGKIVVVNFWATWCPYCVQEMPDLQKLKDNNDDIVLLTIDVDEEKDKVEKYIKDGGYDFQVLLDEGGEVSREYLVSGLPATYFINQEGLFVGRVPSAMNYDQMEEALGVTRDYK